MNIHGGRTVSPVCHCELWGRCRIKGHKFMAIHMLLSQADFGVLETSMHPGALCLQHAVAGAGGGGCLQNRGFPGSHKGRVRRGLEAQLVHLSHSVHGEREAPGWGFLRSPSPP